MVCGEITGSSEWERRVAWTYL